MHAWKVLFIMVLACASLGLALATVVVPMTLSVDEGKWLWLGGLFFAAACTGTLFTLFLRSQDRTYGQSTPRYRSRALAHHVQRRQPPSPGGVPTTTSPPLVPRYFGTTRGG
jgi:hypothetical protein